MFGLWGKKRDSGFAKAMAASFPPGLAPPEPLIRFFEWQEANGLDTIEDGVRYGQLDPDQPDSCMFTTPVDPGHAEAWLADGSPAEQNRLAPFIRTGGDGSYAALWRDDSGAVRIVHLGSGSGSTMVGVMTDDPVDFLRLIAIGYDELCWPENFDKTPEAVHLEQYDEAGDPAYVPRTRLRAWVESSFGVSVPSTAAEIVTSMADMDADESDDPFWMWIRSVQDRA